MQHPDLTKLEQTLPKLKQKIKNKSFRFDGKTTEYEMVYLGNLSDKDEKYDARGVASRFNSFPAGMEEEVELEKVEFVSEQPNLRYLNINFCGLTEKLVIKNCPNLETLYVVQSQLEEIEFEGTFPELKLIDLTGNRLTKFELSVEKFPKLRYLYLATNQLKDLAGLAGFFTRDKQEHFLDFSFEENEELQSPPKEIREQGKKAVESYFELISEEKTKLLFETKVLVIGDGGAGKSSFVTKMKNKDNDLPKDKDTTLGVKVTQWPFEINHPKHGEQKMYANFWDFGGQKLYRGTHQIFFSSKSFYVMLDDGREEKTGYGYWLNTVEQLAGNESKLLVVLNQRHTHKPRPDKNGLKGRFGDLIVDFHDVNLNKKDSSITKLQDKLKFYLQDLPGMGDPLPTSWVNIREELFSLNKKHIPLSDYQKICERKKADLQKLDVLSEYFNRIGVFTHYYDDEVLKHKIFLDNDWLLENVYDVLNHPVVKEEKHGRIEKADLDIIWKKPDLTFETDYLIRLMQRFGLMYKIPDEDKYIVPEHLSEIKPYKTWQFENKKDILQYYYEFDKYMPFGIMAQLIVALHGYIKNHQNVWSQGVNIVYEKDTHAEIVQVFDKNEFIIRLYGEKKKVFLGVILGEFSKILKPFKKLNYEIYVPCTCPQCKKDKEPYFHKLSELEDIKKRGKRSTVFCNKHDEEVSLSELLDGINIKTNNMEKNSPNNGVEPENRKLKHTLIAGTLALVWLAAVVATIILFSHFKISGWYLLVAIVFFLLGFDAIWTYATSKDEISEEGSLKSWEMLFQNMKIIKWLGNLWSSIRGNEEKNEEQEPTTPYPSFINSEEIYFENNSSDLTSEAYRKLSEIANALKETPSLKLKIQGHSDASGTTNHNKGLSKKRALSVFNYLTGNGIDENRLEYIAFGEALATENGERDKNRKVDFKII